MAVSTSLEVGQLVAHRTSPDMPWVVFLAEDDTVTVDVRRVRNDCGVREATFFRHELVPYTDEPLAAAKRLIGLLEEGGFPAFLVEAAVAVHDDIADELDD